MKKFLICLLVLAIILLFVLLNMFCSDLWPYINDIPSPTREYRLEQRYTDFLTPGYRGKTFLVCGNRRWFIANIGPGYAGWLSDTEFFVSDRSAKGRGFYEEYSVFDFIGDP